jgi:hypothetical protein
LTGHPLDTGGNRALFGSALPCEGLTLAPSDYFFFCGLFATLYVDLPSFMKGHVLPGRVLERAQLEV